MTDHAALQHVLAAPATNPTLSDFNQLIWWMVLLDRASSSSSCCSRRMFMIWPERRVIGRTQNRPGPAGRPFGLLQPIADALKLPLKEDIVPRGADKLVFVVARVVSAAPAFLRCAIIPCGAESRSPSPDPAAGRRPAGGGAAVPGDELDDLYGMRCGPAGPRGRPYSLLGALRSAAQVISYEIAMALAFVAVFLYAGSLSTSAIVSAQQHEWYAWLLPVSFVIYLFTMVRRANRLPFDLPEGEGEARRRLSHRVLVDEVRDVLPGRVHQHDDGSALATTLFLGGWRAPWPLSLWASANRGWWPVLWFLIKVFILLFCYIWLRGTLPRVRYDRLTAIGWKVLIPVSIVWILLIATVREWRLDAHQAVPFVVSASSL